jgi:hypothetical protein
MCVEAHVVCTGGICYRRFATRMVVVIWLQSNLRCDEGDVEVNAVDGVQSMELAQRLIGTCGVTRDTLLFKSHAC